MRISDWSSDVCSSDLTRTARCVEKVLWLSPEASTRSPVDKPSGSCRTNRRYASKRVGCASADRTETAFPRPFLGNLRWGGGAGYGDQPVPLPSTNRAFTLVTSAKNHSHLLPHKTNTHALVIYQNTH